MTFRRNRTVKIGRLLGDFWATVVLLYSCSRSTSTNSENCFSTTVGPFWLKKNAGPTSQSDAGPAIFFSKIGPAVVEKQFTEALLSKYFIQLSLCCDTLSQPLNKMSQIENLVQSGFPPKLII